MKISHANRGMGLEQDIDLTNSYYLDMNKAVIYKKPTPIQIVKVNYALKKIVDAYFKIPSTTDYNGIYKGYYIDFDAKETTSKTSFPLANIHKHQIKHLTLCHNHGGIAFIIVRFSKINETYYLSISDLVSYTNSNNTKSIPLSYFKEKGHLIKDKYQPRVDYLNIVDIYIRRMYEEKN